MHTCAKVSIYTQSASVLCNYNLCQGPCGPHTSSSITSMLLFFLFNKCEMTPIDDTSTLMFPTNHSSNSVCRAPGYQIGPVRWSEWGHLKWVHINGAWKNGKQKKERIKSGGRKSCSISSTENILKPETTSRVRLPRRASFAWSPFPECD